jgi:sulfite reductase beta subunit-like hemoprotein
MSVMGQKRKCLRFQVMSALPHKADINSRDCDVRFVPISEVASIDHLVRGGEGRRRNRQRGALGRLLNWRDLFERLSGAHHDFRGHGQAKRPRRLEIDCQIKSRGLLDRQIAALSTLQNFVHICRGTANQRRLLHNSQAHQPMHTPGVLRRSAAADY